MEQASIVIGLSAVVVAVRDGDAVVLTVRREGQLASLPFGPFDPDAYVSQRLWATDGGEFPLLDARDIALDAP